MIQTVPATFIISCKPGDNISDEVDDVDESVMIYISDFFYVPAGTYITLYDKEECLFQDQLITEIHLNNRHGGILVSIDVDAYSFKILLVASKAYLGGFARYIYPNTLSLFSNPRQSITAL